VVACRGNEGACGYVRLGAPVMSKAMEMIRSGGTVTVPGVGLSPAQIALFQETERIGAGR